MRKWALWGLVALIGATVFAACGEPEPPPPPPPPQFVAAPAPPPLPAAPLGASAGPLHPMDAPDPSITVVDPSWCGAGAPACYYAYTTSVGFVIVPTWRSTDLVHWTLDLSVDGGGSAMQTLAPWVEWGYNWAPTVLERPNNPESSRFVMWYTARDAANGKQCLGVATASRPNGLFVDTSTRPAYCQLSDQGTIDASTFLDTDGTAYLVYKSEFPARLWITRLNPDGRSIIPSTEKLLLSGGWTNADVVEAPTMVRANGQVYLFYSTDDWWTDRYRVGVARCDSVLGPCHAVYRTAVLGSRGAMLGPGGQSPVQDPAGNWHMLFHAWTSPQVGYEVGGARALRLLPISFGGQSEVAVG
jgi:beta-xylosidase